MLVKGATGIPIYSIDYPLPNAADLRNLWSYVFCKGVQMTTVGDHLGDAGFNTIAKNSLLELMYNQEKTPLQMDITFAMLPFSLYRIILSYLCFFVTVFKCVYCLQWLHCSLALFGVILWSVLECYQYSLWRYIKLVNLSLLKCYVPLMTHFQQKQ